LKNPLTDDIIEAVAQYFSVDKKYLIKRSRNNLPRKIAVYLAYYYSDGTLQELGEIFGISYAACGKIKKRLMEERKQNKKIDQAITDIIALMSNVKTRHLKV